MIEDAEVAGALNEILKKVKCQGRSRVRSHGARPRGSPWRASRSGCASSSWSSGSYVARSPCASRSPSRRSTGYLTENREKLETGLTFEARHILFLPESGSRARTAGPSRAPGPSEIYGYRARGPGLRRRWRGSTRTIRPARTAAASARSSAASWRRNIEHAILRLSPGRSVDAVRSAVGYHLFRLDARETLTGDALDAGPQPDPRHPLPREVRRAAQGVARRDQTARDHRYPHLKSGVDRAGNRVGQWSATHGSQPR